MAKESKIRAEAHASHVLRGLDQLAKVPDLTIEQIAALDRELTARLEATINALRAKPVFSFDEPAAPELDADLFIRTTKP